MEFLFELAIGGFVLTLLLGCIPMPEPKSSQPDYEGPDHRFEAFLARNEKAKRQQKESRHD